ncbi:MULTISPECIES: magnesium/cobalt transporter CorA [unclassified Psychrobacillus]|uniref:magnesium/cobalt transporter CorA n=1 Tax=unclassified Psychrobacillus TaxID=2636677 RepID=UPI00146D987D|nr:MULTISPECIES: magnesium/cobalt transporter CorA [unclassified Psychrobacillus]MCM3358586.1 magnesium/cobalt transporter CorA [Psychrobacillus sp. MER TA 171]NME05681.1 magnesium/cobalt transporter CorA [Psychrobacillus sp. BL-248-WT-3]
MISTIGRTVNQEVIMDFPLEYIQTNELEWYWVDIGEPTKEEEQLLSSFFHFHPLAIEDCLQMLQRPKLDHYGDYEFFVLHAFNEKEMEAEELNLFVGKDFVVSFHFPPMQELQEARERIRSNPRNWDRGNILITYNIVDKVVDTYFPIVYHIEDYLNEVDERLSMDMDHLSMDQVFDLRSDLLRLRRTIIPMRDLLYRVMYSERINLNQSERAYFDDIYDHLLKLTEMVEANRELTADIRDSYDSINASRMNRIMMILTTVSTVFIPLTFIVGVYGMNFINMPELEWKYGYFIVVGLMVVIATGMIAWFKYKGWFNLFRS